MPRERIAADEAFFAERAAGRPAGRRRSLARAAALAGELGLDLGALRSRASDVIVVVGSKGKGTAATVASACLAAAGLRVATITSPGLRSNRERIRIGGAALSSEVYVPLVERVSARIAAVSSRLPGDGYLSPTGLFTLTGLLHAVESGCDVIVAEAGMGGRSDEVSLLDPGVVVLTAVFGEHLGLLGDNVAGIAEEKLGVLGPHTTTLVTVPQADPEVGPVVGASAAAHGIAPLRAEVPAPPPPGWPAGLSSLNAAAGRAAAHALLRGRGVEPDPRAEDAVLATLSLPGRLSLHVRGGTRWLVDSGCSGVAAEAAVRHCREVMGEPSTVLVSLPADKDRAGTLAALDGLAVRRVRVRSPHLDWSGWEDAEDVGAIDLEELGPRVLALGTVSFVGELLARLDVSCERAFDVPPGLSPRGGGARRSSAR